MNSNFNSSQHRAICELITNQISGGGWVTLYRARSNFASKQNRFKTLHLIYAQKFKNITPPIVVNLFPAYHTRHTAFLLAPGGHRRPKQSRSISVAKAKVARGGRKYKKRPPLSLNKNITITLLYDRQNTKYDLWKHCSESALRKRPRRAPRCPASRRGFSRVEAAAVCTCPSLVPLLLTHSVSVC